MNLPRILRHRLLAATVFTVISLYVYEPAVHRVFVSDQIWYFAELHGDTSVTAGLAHYDYAFSRRYWKGDDALFRPAALIWLAVGNTLFSYHHVMWNIATLALHVLVVFSLFSLLLQIRPGNFALPVAALFAVMTPGLELVVWNHLGGYLLGYLFLAAAMRCFVRMVTAESPSLRDLVVYGVCFTAAIFSHEAMVPICLVAGLILFALWKRRRSLTPARLAIVFAPILLFGSLYLFHMLKVERFTYVDRGDGRGMFDVRNVMAIPLRSLRVTRHWLTDVALPSGVAYQGEPFERLSTSFDPAWRMPAFLLNAVLSLIAIGLVLRVLSLSDLSKKWPVIAVLLSALLAHIGVISLGRGEAEIFTTTYYRYFFCMIFVALVYTMVDFSRLRGGLAAAAWVVLVALFFFHAIGTRAATREIGRANQRASDYVTGIARFVDTHREEPDFSFAVQNPPADVDPEILLVEGYPDNANRLERRTRVSEILFARYYNADRPRYVINSDGLIVTQH